MKNRKTCALSLLLVVLTFVSCGSVAPQTHSGDTSKSEETPSETLQTDDIGKFDFNGEVFDIVYSAEQLGNAWPYSAETENGDILNDAVWRRDLNIKERFNVDIVYHDKGGTGANQLNAMRSSVMAGDNQYDACINHTFSGFNGAIADGILYDFNKLPVINWDKPWWNRSIRENIEIDGVLLAAVSDFIYAYYDVVYFNKSIMDENNIKYPYEKVKSGEWTWDYVAEITKNVTKDLNGDSIYDDNDVWGWAVDENLSSMTRMIHSNGMVMAQTDENGRPSLKGMMSDKMQNVIDKYYDLVWNDNRSYFSKKSGESDIVEIFGGGKAMMMHTQTLKLPRFRDVDFEFGIVPLPKYDVAQEGYLSLASTQMLLIPANLNNPQFTGVMLEALAAGSYSEVSPVLYEVVYENKLLRDGESSEMFNIIRGTLVYDQNWCYGEGNNLTYLIANTVGNKNTDLSSFYAANILSCQQILDRVYDNINKNYIE